jgi:glycogen debranching enzyme
MEIREVTGAFHWTRPLTINWGHLVLISDGSGQVPNVGNFGFYVWDTRLISHWSVGCHGLRWELQSSRQSAHHTAEHFFVNPAIRQRPFNIDAGTLAMALKREITDRMREQVTIVNHGDREVQIELSFRIESDFADLLELRLNRSTKRGAITSSWSEADQELSHRYENESPAHSRSFRRGLAVKFNGDSKAHFANGLVILQLTLQPQRGWTSEQQYRVLDDDTRTAGSSIFFRNPGELGPTSHDDVVSFKTSNIEVQARLETSLADLRALRLVSLGDEPNLYTVSAGIPWFATVFGRDSIVASLQSLMVDKVMALGTLSTLAKYQGTKLDSYREEQPGKIFHEIRLGEASVLGETIFTPFYGTADATILYLILLHDYWRWTGDETVVDRYLGTAERCLDWIERYGDRDNDGFQEYLSQTSEGYYHVGWKDSFDSVRHADGTLVVGPTALCELQGYVYDAWSRMAELYTALGRDNDADALRAKATRLKQRFNDVFWNEPLGIYAYALDGQKRQVLTEASNIGHCLWSGIVSDERAPRVAATLLSPQMASGWGIRTLSALHPSFNPFSYHNGSVWPHDNAIIAMGLRRYGLAGEAATIVHDVYDAGARFEGRRLPEFYAGVSRDTSISRLSGRPYAPPGHQESGNFVSGNPVSCPAAGIPQAWAAGSAFHLLNALLAMRPDAPNGKLYVDPRLPDWLPELTLSGVRVAGDEVQLRFWREGETSLFESRSMRVTVERRDFRG